MHRRVFAARVALGLACVAAALPRDAGAALATAGFRAVAVAHAADPISAVAVAPDGRLFAAVQSLGQTADATPGTAEIRVYATYSSTDGAQLDEGTRWATIDGVRATNGEEGLLGLALAPDFATSRLVYVYLTTTDENVNQHVRVYRENGTGLGEYLGTVATGLEPPAESSTRNGGPLAFGVDGCLYAGVGDNGSSSRWNAQLLRGTDPFQSSETASLCTNVCLGPTLYPGRPNPSDGAANHAGKVLRLAVEGASPAAAAPGAPLAAQPFAFATGFRNPVAFGVHPLTGQVYAGDRGDGQQAELDVVEGGSNQGWPCLEGVVVGVGSQVACLTGRTQDDVYAQHADWHGPIVSHAGTAVPSAIAVYTGLAYPAEYFGDVFYVLRDSARIYRLDLQPPCFLPHPNGVAPVAFHDSTEDGDFTALYDRDDDGQLEFVFLPVLSALVQAPDPLGRQVLYLVGKEGTSIGSDSVVFRVEFATAFTPWTGTVGRVADSCFSDGVYSGGSGPAPYAWENPFQRPSCLPPGGPCPGQPDGTACDDGDPCNGAEACLAGVCRHGTPPSDGTACTGADGCHVAGVCQAGACVAGPALPDGTPCGSADPCEASHACAAGVCQASGGPAALAVRSLVVGRFGGPLALDGSVHAGRALAPEATDDLRLELRDGADVVFAADLSHPASDPFWHRARGGLARYADRRGGIGGVTRVRLRSQRSGDAQLAMHAKRPASTGLDDAAIQARVVVGGRCFVADLAGRCKLDRRKLRCR